MTAPTASNPLRVDTVLSAAALALSAACTTAWLAGWGAAHNTLISRLILFIAALAVSGGLLHFLLQRLSRREHEARHYLERLCQLDPAEASSDLAGVLPAIHPKSPWHGSLLRLQQTFALHASRTAELEHAKAALEIRCRRSAADCERMTNIVNGVSEPVVAVDQYDELLLANPSAKRLLGIDLAGTEKRILSQIVRCEKLVALVNDTRRRKVRTSRTEEVELESPEGEKRWYAVTATSIPSQAEAAAEGGEEGNDGVVAVLRDISTQKVIQRHNAEFVSAASHEMKTPLAGIKAYVELLADGDAEDEETREEFLKVINGQADRLQRLIDNLLNLARIEAGVVKVNKQAQPLNEILAEAIGVVNPAAEAKQIKLVQDLSPLYLPVLVDRDMMLQAAINLLSNAVKYTAPGGTVTLRSRLAVDQVQFEVEDTGVGLSEEDCEKVFSKFYRVEKNKNMAPGTGLGLPLAKHIVEDVHSGRLTVTSQLDVGSTFMVTIPSAARSASS